MFATEYKQTRTLSIMVVSILWILDRVLLLTFTFECPHLCIVAVI